MVLTPWKLPSGAAPGKVPHLNYTLEVTLWKLIQWSYLIDLLQWKLAHGSYTIEVT